MNDPLIFGEQTGSKDTPPPEEVAALLNGLKAEQEQQRREPTELEIACGGQLLLVQCPAIITTTKEQGAKEFVVNDLQAWGWTPFGILAVGRYSDDPEDDPERSVLFKGEDIHTVEMQKDLYKQILTEIKEETEAEEAAEVEPEAAEAEPAAA